MGLLSGTDITNILGAIKGVTDTFMVTPVEYQQVGQSLDIMQEKRKDRVDATFNLSGLVEYPDNASSFVKEETNGAIDKADVKVSFNMEDLIAHGGIVNAESQVSFNATKDYMILNGIKYQVNFVKYDGPLQKQNVLVIVYGVVVEKKT